MDSRTTGNDVFDGGPSRRPLPAPSFTYASNEVGPVSQRVIRFIEKLSGQPRIRRLYEAYTERGRPPELFWSDAVQALRLDIALNKRPADALPAAGPVMVVANHPFGVVDGVVLCWIVSQVRADFRIMTHRVLHQAPEVQRHVLPVDFSGTKAALANNVHSRREAKKILAARGVLIVFPSGAVAMSRDFRGEAVDLEWKALAAKLALTGGADVVPVFFSGQNSRLYQVAANIHQTLKLSLLFHEVRNKIGSRIAATIGDVIPNATLRSIGDSRAVTEFLRQATYRMAPARRRSSSRPPA